MAGVATVEVTIDAVTASVSITLVPGPVASVTVAPGVDTLVADGADQTTLVVTSTDASGNSTSGDNQAITANLGTASGLAEAAPGVLDATFTASDQPGVATVEVTIDGITGTASITLVSPAVASVKVTVGSDTLAADGLSQTTIAVASADVLGNPTSGDNQTINTNLGVVSGLAATGPGAHEATFTSGTDAGVATLEVTIDAVTASVSISLLPGSVSSVNIALGSNTLLAGGVEQTTVTATSTDASGNPTSGQNQAINTNVGTVSALAEVGPGVLEATFTSGPDVGTANIDVTIDGISASASIGDFSKQEKRYRKIG